LRNPVWEPPARVAGVAWSLQMCLPLPLCLPLQTCLPLQMCLPLLMCQPQRVYLPAAQRWPQRAGLALPLWQVLMPWVRHWFPSPWNLQEQKQAQ